MATGSLLSNYSILKNRDFRYLLSGRFCVTLALQLQGVVVGWQVYEIKKDPLYLGLIGLTEAVPAISLALVGGYIVDRGQPISIYRAVLLLALAGAVTLLMTAGGLVPISTDSQVTAIFAVIFLLGVVRAFAWPSMFSITPQVVPRDRFVAAQSWLSAFFDIGAISGPAIGGLMYAWKGPKGAYSLSVLLLGVAFAASLLLKVGRIDRKREGQGKEPILKSLSSGARFVFSNQVILGALSLDMFAVLFGGATALLPVFASDILESGPESLGLLRAAPSVGALLMSMIVIHRPLGKGAGRLLFWAVAGYGVCIIGFGLSRALWFSVLLLGLSGAFDAVSVVIRHTILQLWTPDDMRGRVSAVNMIFIGSSNEIGAFESGVAARLLGTVPAVVFGGMMTLLVVASAAWLAPKLRQIDLSDPDAGKSEAAM